MEAGFTLAAGDLEAELLVAADGARVALADDELDAVQVQDVESVIEQ